MRATKFSTFEVSSKWGDYKQVVFVPIANLIVEESFEFCSCIVQNLSKQMVDELFENTIKTSTVKNKNYEKSLEKFRSNYQGYGVVKVELNCEPNSAHEISVKRVSELMDLLGIYSGSVLIPDIKCTSKIKGSEYSPNATTFIIDEGFILSILNVQPLDIASMRSWIIRKKDIEKYKELGMGFLSSLVTKEKRNGYESTILNMAFIYAKAAFTNDPMEKLILMLSSLESTLLVNQSESIQQNIAERLSLLISDKLDERKSIIANLKEVYKIRSRFLHHGHTSNEINCLSNFYLNVWLLFCRLFTSTDFEFKTKEEFLGFIDDCKLSP